MEGKWRVAGGRSREKGGRWREGREGGSLDHSPLTLDMKSEGLFAMACDARHRHRLGVSSALSPSIIMCWSKVKL